MMDWKNILPYVNTGLLVFVSVMVTYGTFFRSNVPTKAQPTARTAPQARAPVQKTDINMASLTKDTYSKGASNPKATIVVFNSFTCGFCSRSRDVLNQMIEKYPKDVKLVYRHYNRSETDIAAAEAVECAGEQGKFWQMHDAIFSQGVKGDYVPYASSLGLNKGQFQACMGSSKYRDKTMRSTNEGRQLGITGTPAFVIDGTLSVGYKPFESFEKMVKQYF